MSLEHFKKSLKNAPVIKKGDYSYIIHPITDGIPEIKPELLKEIINKMKKHIEKFLPIDKIVTIESMGIPLATALSLDMDIPFTIIRKRKYGLEGEISVDQVTGYSKSKLYINGLKKGDNVIIVDDLISTGGTLKAVLSGLKQIGVNVKGVVVAVDKGDFAKEISNEIHNNITSIVELDVIGDIVGIQWFLFNRYIVGKYKILSSFPAYRK